MLKWILIAVAAFVTLTTLAALLIAVAFRPDDPFSPPDPSTEPIPDQKPFSLETSGLRRGERYDWAMTRMRNQTNEPATIRHVELIPGGPSQNLMPDPEFFVLGVDRSFGDGAEDAPSGVSWWGVTPEPAVGYVIPPKNKDVNHLGVNIMVRLTVGDFEDVSFKGLRVLYEWEGDEYEYTSNSGVLYCRLHREPGKGWVLARLCRQHMRG